MSRQRIYETRDLVDAGAFHENVLARCPCGHWAILDSIDLWGYFRRRGWNQHIKAVPQRLSCTKCFQAGRPKRRPVIELVTKVATVKLPHVHDDAFKREVRRRR